MCLCLQDEEPEAGGSAGHSELDPNSDDDIEEGEDEEGVKDIVICQFDKVRAVRLGEAARCDLIEAYLSNQATYLSNQAAYLSNQATYLSNKATYLSNQATYLSNQATYLSNKATYLSNKTMYL